MMDHYDPREQDGDVANKNHAVGLSLANQDIYYANISLEESKYHVHNFGKIHTNIRFGTGAETVEANVNSLAGYLNGIFNDQTLTTKRANLSLNSHVVTMSKTYIDKDIGRKQFEDQVRWEFCQHTLEDDSHYRVNTCNLEYDKQNELNLTLILGVRQKFVKSFADVFSKTRGVLSNIDVDILCTHATCEKNYQPMHDGLTTIIEARKGVITVLLCKNFDVKRVYKFPTPSKTTFAGIADLINHHVPYIARLYNEETGLQEQVARTILSNELAAKIEPHIDKKLNATTVDPFQYINLPDSYSAAEESEDETEEKEKSEPEAATDFSVYAECVGAAIKLIDA